MPHIHLDRDNEGVLRSTVEESDVYGFVSSQCRGAESVHSVDYTHGGPVHNNGGEMHIGFYEQSNVVGTFAVQAR